MEAQKSPSQLGQTVNRTIRIVWAIAMSAVAVALLIGAIQIFNKSRTNDWVDVPFQGTVLTGEVVGHYVWDGQRLDLTWPGQSVPDHIQLNAKNASELRLEGLTGKEERLVAIKMLLLAGTILAVTWAVTYYIWTRGRLVDLS